jgi:hypothetical protein
MLGSLQIHADSVVSRFQRHFDSLLGIPASEEFSTPFSAAIPGFSLRLGSFMYAAAVRKSCSWAHGSVAYTSEQDAQGKHMWRTSVLSIVFLGITACASIANSPMVVKQLKIVSAGHTGCLPDENELSNINASPDGSGTWNATCKGKVYLCSGVQSVDGSESFSCATVAN